MSANAPKIKKARARLNENANEFIDYFYRKNLAVFGEEYFIKFTESGATNSFEASEHNITVNFKAGAALEQKANYIKRKYSELLQEKSKDILDKALEALDKDINYFSDWVFTWSIDKWVYYDVEKNIALLYMIHTSF